MNSNLKSACLILAAGTSSRLGVAKQLVRFRGMSLINYQIKIAIQLKNIDEVIVVLGHLKEEILRQIDSKEVSVVTNEDYLLGMGSSLKKGMEYVKRKCFDQCLVMLCDQVFIPIDHYQSLLKHSTKVESVITATKYKSIKGVPAVFKKSTFDQLLSIPNDKGAGALIKRIDEDLSYIICEEAIEDIDHPEDLNKLNE